MVADLLILFSFLGLGEESEEALAELVTAMTSEGTRTYTDLSPEEKTEVLKRCTLMVRKLNNNIACYPLSETAVVYFDAEGNPL